MSILEQLLADHESKTLEFKRDTSSVERIMRAIVAFANGAGGTLLVGVEDRTRRVCGVSKPTDVEEQLANLIADRIAPRLVPELQILPWRKSHVVAVRVYPSALRPHYVKSEGPSQGVYVRVGSTNRKADSAQIEEIGRFVKGHTFDEEPLPDMNSEAIDFRAASECFAPVRKLKAGDLRTLQLTTSSHGREVPTVGGILLFGKERLDRFPDARIRAGCFSGTDRTIIADSAEINAYLPLAIEETMHFVRRNIRRAMPIEGTRHTEAWEYPLVAVREAVANAVVHADYSQRGAPIRLAIFADRIEVDNPGGLLPGLTIHDIQLGVSRLRNRTIGRVFHELGLIEQWGSGIQRMISACKAAGLSEPKLEEIGSGFRVTLSQASRSAAELDGCGQLILNYIRASSGASTAQVARHIGLTTRATRERLNRMESLGLVVAAGSSLRDPKRRFLPAAGV